MAENTIFKLFSLSHRICSCRFREIGTFTEQTSVLTIPVLNGQRTIWELLRRFVILGNLIGVFYFTLFISLLAFKLVHT
jgi:formate/nitrite transporter FocA (FNT family)